MNDPVRLPLPIDATLPLYDHRVRERPVLPAAHALALMAREVETRTGRGGHHSRDARFASFLPLPAEPGWVQAFLELREEEDGSLLAVLLTRITAQRSTVTRLKPHLQVVFCAPRSGPLAPPPAASLFVAEPVFPVTPERLYRELVPFGPAFRNLSGEVRLYPAGVAAAIRAPAGGSASIAAPAGGPDCPALGCPFVFDAALHAVNVWTQRHRGMVTFPVGYARRHVLDPTREGEEYLCRALPHTPAAGSHGFDLWILDRQDRVREAVFGVEMRELFPGSLRPPAWILAQQPG